MKYMSYAEYKKNKTVKPNKNNIEWKIGTCELSSFYNEIEMTITGDVTRVRHGKTLGDIVDDVYAKLNNASRADSALKIKKVHFSAPVTCVIWEDGTKTLVRTQEGDWYDPEKGLAMAIAKKALGNTGAYYDEIKKWVEPYNKECQEIQTALIASLVESLKEQCDSEEHE